jgi:hypothetical protein
MHHDRIALANPVEHVQGLPAFDHVILGEDLEPIDGGVAVKDLLVMLGPEPQAKAEIRRLVAGHGFSSSNLAGEAGREGRGRPFLA